MYQIYVFFTPSWLLFESEWIHYICIPLDIHCIHTHKRAARFQPVCCQTGGWAKYWDMIHIELGHIWQWPLGQTGGCALMRGQRLVAWIQYEAWLLALINKRLLLSLLDACCITSVWSQRCELTQTSLVYPIYVHKEIYWVSMLWLQFN